MGHGCLKKPDYMGGGVLSENRYIKLNIQILICLYFCCVKSYISPADAGLDLDFWYIENILTDYDSQHLLTSESS